MSDKRFKLHPVCKLFPKYTDEERGALLMDVKAKGKILTPIITKEFPDFRMVYDGQNRLDVGEELGIDIPYIEFPGTEAECIDHVMSLNFVRRELQPSQKAMIAVQFEGLQLKLEGKDRRKRKKENPDETAPEGNAPTAETGDLATYLAAKYSVSRPLIFKAMAVAERGTAEMAKDVINLKITLPAAYTELLRIEAEEAQKEEDRKAKRKKKKGDSEAEPAGGSEAPGGSGDESEGSDAPVSAAAPDDEPQTPEWAEAEAEEEEEEAEEEKGPVVDAFTNPVPKKMTEAFTLRDTFEEVIDALRELKPKVKKELVDHEGATFLDGKEADRALESVAKLFKNSQPHAPCLKCRARGCDECQNGGWVNKILYDIQLKAKEERAARRKPRDETAAELPGAEPEPAAQL